MDQKDIETKTNTNKKFKLRLETRLKNGALTQAREKLELTQKQVADKIGISSSTYSNIERMQYFPPEKTQNKIIEFYDLFEITLDPNEVFPKELRKTKPYSKYTIDQEIPSSKLMPYSEANKEFLEYTHLDEEIMGEELKREIENSLDSLTPKEAEVIELYFGLGEDPDPKYFQNMKNIGRKLNVGSSRIGQIKNKALMKLRHASRSKTLEEFL